MRKLVLPISVLLVCPMIMAGGNSLSADDIAKIKRVHALYQEAWLRGDAGGVRAVSVMTVCCSHHMETSRESVKRD